MRTVTRTYEVFPIEELNTAAQEKAYHNWLENGDYAWASENRETLEAFCDIFNVDCRFWEYDAYSHNFHYSTRHSGNIESLKGQRLATYITNNYWATLYPPKQYWKNGKKRESRIFSAQCLFHPKSGSSSNLVQVILSWKALPFVLTVQIQPCHTSLFSCFLICLRDPLQLHYSKGI